jgi:hypothetical protein
MAKNSNPRELLQAKLNVKRAQLYGIAKKVSDSLSISTADAILLLAAKNGINLHKHAGDLPEGKIEKLRSLLPYLPQPIATTPVATPPDRQRRSRPKDKKTLGTQVKLLRSEEDPVLDKKTLDEMKAMIPVYEILYHLENSMRQFVSRVLKAKHGTEWWDKVAPQGLKDTVKKRTTDDAINAWHQKRSTESIHYLDLNQLPTLVRATQADFVQQFLPSLEWFQQFVDELYRSRCVVSHMNPLVTANIDAVAVRFNQWQQLVKGKAEDLKALE